MPAKLPVDRAACFYKPLLILKEVTWHVLAASEALVDLSEELPFSCVSWNWVVFPATSFSQGTGTYFPQFLGVTWLTTEPVSQK